MVLAAGLGTRMRHLRDSTPKPLIRVGGKALIDHVLDGLSAAGVGTAVVNVHHLADRIEGHLRGRIRPRIVLSDERTGLLDTGGGVRRALPQLGGSVFFVHNADSIWRDGSAACLERLAAAWDGARMDALLLVAPRDEALGYDGGGDFDLDGEGRLRRRLPGRPAPYVFTGVSLASPALFEVSPEGAFSLNLLWDRAMAAGRLHGVRHVGRWMHVGTPEAIAEADRCLAEVLP